MPRSYIAGEYVAPTMHFIRPVAYDHAGAARLPARIATLPDRPTVYATLGTATNRAPALIAAILAGLRGAGVNLVLTVGCNVDPEQFGPQPPHVRIARYIPQTLLLPHCDAVVTHGGFGTVMAALEHGLPLVVTPMAADQPANARRCAACGVGVVVGPEERTPEAIRAAVEKILGDASYRQNAARMQREIAALPGPAYAVELLEWLATEKRPLVSV
jgi:MGT family glycosyltransferase